MSRVLLVNKFDINMLNVRVNKITSMVYSWACLSCKLDKIVRKNGGKMH